MKRKTETGSIYFNGKDISKLNDYSSLYEIKEAFSKSEEQLSDGRILFIVPKDEVKLNDFQESLYKNGNDANLLMDDYLLKVLHHNYLKMEVQIFISHGTDKDGRVIAYEPLIDLLSKGK